MRKAPTHNPHRERAVVRAPIRDGYVLIGSDGHYWETGRAATAHRAFLHFIKKLRPKLVIYNGDALDGASIGRHPKIGWEHQPSLAREMAAVQRRLGEIERAAKRARLIWTLGNHDARFNTRLANLVPEYRNIHGTRLVHHFPAWEPAWMCEVGGKQGVLVKHRFTGGVHAPHVNAMRAGRSIVTGHTHALKITPYTDYLGTRYGVDCGTLADPDGPQFLYAEKNPSNHRAGFAVLQWRKGQLFPPEIVEVVNEKKGLVVWRGKMLKV